MSEKQKPSLADGPLRVAYIIGKMWAGGVEAVVFNYYRVIDHEKVQFDFFYDEDSTVEPPEDIIKMGARFYKLPPYQEIWKYIPTLKKLLKKNKYTIVHSHLNTISVFPLYAAWRVGVPVRIAHNHSVPGGNEWKRNFAKELLRKLSRIFATDYFACSEKAGRWLFGDKLYDAGKINIIRNAIDFDKFSSSKDNRDGIRSLLDIENDCIVVGHVGRFTFAKNHTKLLNVYKKLLSDYRSSRLLLVGDGELRDDIEKTMNDLGITESTILTGKVSDPEKYYAAMDVIVLPSIFEGFSMTTLEAQAAQIPVVISEAIPDEAIISNGCVRATTTDADDIWISAISDALKINVQLDTRKNEFELKKCGLLLQNWYIDKAESGGGIQ